MPINWGDVESLSIDGVNISQINEDEIKLWPGKVKWYEIYDKATISTPSLGCYVLLSTILQKLNVSGEVTTSPMTSVDIKCQSIITLYCADKVGSSGSLVNVIKKINTNPYKVSLYTNGTADTYEIPDPLANAHIYYANDNTGELGVELMDGRLYSKEYNPAQTSLASITFEWAGENVTTKHPLHKIVGTIKENGESLNIELKPTIITRSVRYRGMQFTEGEKLWAVFDKNGEMLYFTRPSINREASVDFYSPKPIDCVTQYTNSKYTPTGAGLDWLPIPKSIYNVTDVGYTKRTIKRAEVSIQGNVFFGVFSGSNMFIMETSTNAVTFSKTTESGKTSYYLPNIYTFVNTFYVDDNAHKMGVHTADSQHYFVDTTGWGISSATGLWIFEAKKGVSTPQFLHKLVLTLDDGTIITMKPTIVKESFTYGGVTFSEGQKIFIAFNEDNSALWYFNYKMNYNTGTTEFYNE